MKSSRVFIVFILVLFFFSQGKLKHYETLIITGGEASRARICAKGEPMADCTDQNCTVLCNKKYGEVAKTGGSRGYCVSGGCTCLYICGASLAVAHVSTSTSTSTSMSKN
ncbi:hypothetical protein DKX38_017155 [Salix brachista]|uniref:Knottin scorpion toxin-like domain-containing protein n=1 Tax=Salix brachista TaxID=2182728 RepID=A0A5N5KUG4_9ROSI|nr:hypothetical protein DKX38_017155 [Salix brachista]